MANEDKNTEDTFIVMRSILTDMERDNIEMKRMLDRTNRTIAKTKEHIERLERLKVWTEHNLHERFHR